MPDTIHLEQVIDLKAGENSHQGATLLVAVDSDGKPLGRSLYDTDQDLGQQARLPGWINIGDFSACLRTTSGLGEVYKESKTPHVAVASKHTRPVVIANGRTQLEAVVKAIAGDLNSPFGGVWGLNTPLEHETAVFLNRMFIEGITAPEYEEGTAELLRDSSKVGTHRNRFLLQTGHLTPGDVNVFAYTLTPVACGHFIKQDREAPFDVREEAVVITGNNGNSDIRSLDAQLIDDIHFAGNAALYLSSNLMFFVHNGAVAGLGDGCGARNVAAEKARMMLERSAYAGVSTNNHLLWQRILYDTPFTRDDFEGALSMPLRLTAFSDAFFPKLDGFVETSGLDRIHPEFTHLQVQYTERGQKVTFIPKRSNLDSNYNRALIPQVIVQPGGCMGDKHIVPMANKYGRTMVFTMTPEQGRAYLAGEKIEGRTPTGRRFFGHTIMH